MNCLEFRRLYDTDPGCQDSHFLAHARACDECAAFARRGATLERRLHAAMRVKTPENLSSKILVKQVFRRERQIKRPRAWPVIRWMLAASVVLAIGSGAVLINHLRAPSLGHAVMALVDEAEHALVPRAPVSLEDIRAALKPVGIDLNGEPGVVTFASPCVVRGKLAGHIVIKGEKAPISILLMPNESVSGRLTIERSDLKGVLLPMKQGAIAILGAPEEELSAIENKVLSLFKWQV